MEVLILIRDGMDITYIHTSQYTTSCAAPTQKGVSARTRSAQLYRAANLVVERGEVLLNYNNTVYGQFVSKLLSLSLYIWIIRAFLKLYTSVTKTFRGVRILCKIRTRSILIRKYE